MQLELWQAVVLGLVEGITEYLPISSTGHLILASAFMGLGGTPEQQQAIDDFNIVIQGGAIAAVVGLYWPSLVRMGKGLLGQDEAGLRLLVNLFIAFLPAAAIGLFLKDPIEHFLFRPVPVLLALGLGGIYMMIADLRATGRLGLPHKHGSEPGIFDLVPAQALFIGFLQCIAMWPGVSRSMMTITGGIWCGMRPRQAAEFSFLLGLPTLLAATVYKLAKNIARAHHDGTPHMFEQLGYLPCLVGIVVAAVSAAVAVRWLVSFLNRHGLTPFGWYRLALCFVVAGLVFSGKATITPPEKGHQIKSQSKTVEGVQWK
ncbi:MAG: undecaprenyl-diphosphate phosphatase [Phycisphaerae bacterium]